VKTVINGDTGEVEQVSAMSRCPILNSGAASANMPMPPGHEAFINKGASPTGATKGRVADASAPPAPHAHQHDCPFGFNGHDDKDKKVAHDCPYLQKVAYISIMAIDARKIMG
jgi:hypothetical protein